MRSKSKALAIDKLGNLLQDAPNGKLVRLHVDTPALSVVKDGGVEQVNAAPQDILEEGVG